MYAPVLVTPPAELPVTLAEAKVQLRVFHDEEDDKILRHVRTAVGHLDGYRGVLGRCLVEQTWSQAFDAWDAYLTLPFPDARDIVVTYRDDAGDTQTVLSSLYWHGRYGTGYRLRWLDAFSWPSFDEDPAPITVTFTVGFGAAADVPDDIKDAVLIHVEALHDRLREENWRPLYESLISKYRLGTT